MELNNDLMLSTTIGKRAGTPETITCRLSDFPMAAVEKFLTYGFQRVFNDAVGGADTPAEDKVKAAKAMIERFKRGEVGRTRGEAPDPFMKIVLRIVKRRVKATHPDKYKIIMEKDKPDDIFRQVLDATEKTKPEVYAGILNEATEERKRQETEAARLAKLDVVVDL